MTIGEGKAVWLFFENISEYLFSFFSKKVKNQIETIDELESKLKFEYEISIQDLLENNSTKIQNALEKIEVYLLDEIIESIESDSQHEIILAKNNRSMWQLLGNCSFIITTSGITSYESVYVGIPSITFYENENQYFLIKELLENDITINGGIFKDNSINKLSRILSKAKILIYKTKIHLMEIKMRKALEIKHLIKTQIQMKKIILKMQEL